MSDVVGFIYRANRDIINSAGYAVRDHDLGNRYPGLARRSVWDSVLDSGRGSVRDQIREEVNP